MKFFILCFLVFAAIPVLGAQLNFVFPAQEIFVNQQFRADLFLDTEKEDLNAIEGKIAFPADYLEIKEIRDGNSIINFWIERPRAGDGEIFFSGIIPGGYQGQKGFLFSVVFQAKASGNDVIEIRDAKVLLNDGKGTPAKTIISNFQFSISKEASKFKFQDLSFEDTYPPEEFAPEISQDPNIFDGKYFLVFATQDKGSGIDHYEVCEKIKTRCAIAESPYLLKDQGLRSYIYVKAFDKTGNERIAVVFPRYPLKWYEKYLFWIIIIIVVLVYYVFRKIKKGV